MTKMDKFVEAMAVAMELAKDIPGISEVRWNIGYSGNTAEVNQLVRKMNTMMNEVNGNGTGTVDGIEVAA